MPDGEHFRGQPFGFWTSPSQELARLRRTRSDERLVSSSSLKRSARRPGQARRKARTASTRRCWVGRLGQPELPEDLRHVGLGGAFGDDQPGGDGPVGHALGDQPQHLSFPLAQFSERVLPAAPPDQARDDRGVDHRLPVHDAAQGVHHGGDVEDALLEQVADPFGLLLDEAHGVAGFDVLGQGQARLATSESRCPT
jgi:hypothetical protein